MSSARMKRLTNANNKINQNIKSTKNVQNKTSNNKMSYN